MKWSASQQNLHWQVYLLAKIHKRTSGQASQCLNRFLSPNKVSEYSYCLSCDFIATFSDRCCVQRGIVVSSRLHHTCCQYTELCGVNATVKWGQCFVFCVRPQQRFCRGRTHHYTGAGRSSICMWAVKWREAENWQSLDTHWTLFLQCSSSTEMCLQAADWNLSKCGGVWISKCYLYLLQT